MNYWRKTAADVVSALRWPAVWIPAAVLAVGTTIFWTTDLDVALLRPFFSDDAVGQTRVARWPQMHAQPWQALYDWGVYPAWILGGGGLIVWIVSFFWARIERWRDPGLFYALLLIVGPGILVNEVCKPFWQRPRPHDTAPFSGQRDFIPVGQRGCVESDASFPSGHAATGFYLMAPAFVLYRRRRRLAASFMLLGLASGVVIGLARMAVGCHFPSDVFWSGGLVYFTGLALAAPFRFGRGKDG
ncbi:MAG: phosphatase PAP2 family protein [Pirellulales bacterium]|nr:phosphatase PAP2 family protein [Pirellulales bacterium]